MGGFFYIKKNLINKLRNKVPTKSASVKSASKKTKKTLLNYSRRVSLLFKAYLKTIFL